MMFDMLGMRGTAATVGVPPSNAKIEISPLAHLLGSRKYQGCREGDSYPTEFIPRLCEMQQDGNFPVESKHCLNFEIISATYLQIWLSELCKVYDYKDLDLALHDLREGKVTKPVIHWS